VLGLFCDEIKGIHISMSETTASENAQPDISSREYYNFYFQASDEMKAIENRGGTLKNGYITDKHIVAISTPTIASHGSNIYLFAEISALIYDREKEEISVVREKVMEDVLRHINSAEEYREMPPYMQEMEMEGAKEWATEVIAQKAESLIASKVQKHILDLCYDV